MSDPTMSEPVASEAIDLFAAFAVDTKAEREGVETLVPGCGNTKFIIARADNVKYSAALAKAVRRNKPLIDSGGEAGRAKLEEIFSDVMSKHLLLGWVGQVKFKGKMLSYSQDNARLLLSLRDFRDAVLTVASTMETFLVAKDEEDAEKN